MKSGVSVLQVPSCPGSCLVPRGPHIPGVGGSFCLPWGAVLGILSLPRGPHLPRRVSPCVPGTEGPHVFPWGTPLVPGVAQRLLSVLGIGDVSSTMGIPSDPRGLWGPCLSLGTPICPKDVCPTTALGVGYPQVPPLGAPKCPGGAVPACIQGIPAGVRGRDRQWPSAPRRGTIGEGVSSVPRESLSYPCAPRMGMCPSPRSAGSKCP